MIKDSIVESTIKDIEDRRDVGFKKYGVTLDRDDLSLLDWATHAYEQSLDKSLYLKKICTILKEQELKTLGFKKQQDHEKERERN